MKIILEIGVERRDYQEFRPVIGTGFTTDGGHIVNNVRGSGSTIVQMPDGTQYVFLIGDLFNVAAAHHEKTP